MAGFAASGRRDGVREGRDRAGVVAFNLRHSGHVVPYEDVEVAARARGIAVRGGCFCNPGAAEHAFGFAADRARACLRRGFTVPRLRACLGGAPVGAVRVSLGIPTTTSDVEQLLAFVSDLTC